MDTFNRNKGKKKDKSGLTEGIQKEEVKDEWWMDTDIKKDKKDDNKKEIKDEIKKEVKVEKRKNDDYLLQGLQEDRNQLVSDLEVKQPRRPVKLETFRKQLPAAEKREQIVGMVCMLTLDCIRKT